MTLFGSVPSGMISLMLSAKRDTSLRISTTTGQTLSDNKMTAIYAQAQHNLNIQMNNIQQQISDKVDAIVEQPFVNSLLLNIATIAAFIVGVVSYVYRSTREWYANGGKEQLGKVTLSVLRYINSVSESLYYRVEDQVTDERTV